MAEAKRHAPQGPVKADPMRASDPMRPKCSAKSKQKGVQCRQPAIPGGTVCRYHGGAAPQVQAKARERLMALAPLAVDTLASLLARDEFPTVQLGAARYVFDQAEGTATESVKMEHSGGLVFQHETLDP